MNNKQTVLNVMQAIRDLVIDMSEEDLNKFLSDDYAFSLKFTKIISQKNETGEDSSTSTYEKQSNREQVFTEILSQLDLVTSREDGIKILNDNLKTKSALESFAKYIDVGVQKIDKTEKIRENIIESTVGARLRSDAIQGKASE